MIRRPLARHCLASALLGAMLASCASAPTRIFTLDAVPPAGAPARYAGPALRVDAVHVPPSLDRIEMVQDIAPGELRIRDMDHWSAPLGETARQALSADLLVRLPQGRLVFPSLAKPAGALGVSVDILAFHTDGEGAELQASWQVTGSAAEPAPQLRAVSLHLDTPAAGTAPAATARAWSGLLAQLADRIVASLPSGG